MKDFLKADYLKNGNAIQQKTFQIISSLNILQTLENYQPIIVGTIPINIDIDNSDVDIILQTDDAEELNDFIFSHFQHFNDFNSEIVKINSDTVVVSNFMIDNLPFEIYASSIPTLKQNGYLHMLKEEEILLHFGESFRQDIIALKQSGYKTEPAFCKLLGITGDPYVELLKYKIKKDEV